MCCRLTLLSSLFLLRSKLLLCNVVDIAGPPGDALETDPGGAACVSVSRPPRDRIAWERPAAHSRRGKLWGGDPYLFRAIRAPFPPADLRVDDLRALGKAWQRLSPEDGQRMCLAHPFLWPRRLWSPPGDTAECFQYPHSLRPATRGPRIPAPALSEGLRRKGQQANRPMRSLTWTWPQISGRQRPLPKLGFILSSAHPWPCNQWDRPLGKKVTRLLAPRGGSEAGSCCSSCMRSSSYTSSSSSRSQP